jgi:hypothetical protein
MDLFPLEKTETRRFGMRHIIVTGNVPKETRVKGQIYQNPTRFAVVCTDVERAIELAKQAYPDMKVISAADQGAIDKVDNS